MGELTRSLNPLVLRSLYKGHQSRNRWRKHFVDRDLGASMGDRKRQHEQQDRFLSSHFSSGGELAVEESVRGSGPDELKEVVLDILQERETVTR